MSYVSPIKIGYAAEPEEGWTDKIGKYLAGEVDNLVLQSCVKVGCHVDKDELEKALRYDRDQYVKGYEDGKRDAAAAIEELQQIADHYEQTAKDYWKEACEYKAQLPKRGEWELIDGAEPMRWGCSRCKYMSWDTSNYCPRCGAKMEVQDGKRCD